ncbi:MAG: hypothetical protein JRN39_00675 [Nitrososphaerota archaeon]|nr:hypothetical protein [Nitrososphaerota archaeon]MDG6938909.1 hypothetical protein [Nitrososphaerota archaeon]
MITLHGEERLPVGGKAVLEFLADPGRFAQCLPNLAGLEGGNGDEFAARFKVEIPEGAGVGYMKNIGVRMVFRVSRGPDEVGIHGEGRSAGVKIKLDLRILVHEEAQGSRLEWDASLDAGLLERLIGGAKFESMTRGMAGEIISCLAAKTK